MGQKSNDTLWAVVRAQLVSVAGGQSGISMPAWKRDLLHDRDPYPPQAPYADAVQDLPSLVSFITSYATYRDALEKHLLDAKQARHQSQLDARDTTESYLQDRISRLQQELDAYRRADREDAEARREAALFQIFSNQRYFETHLRCAHRGAGQEDHTDQDDPSRTRPRTRRGQDAAGVRRGDGAQVRRDDHDGREGSDRRAS